MDAITKYRLDEKYRQNFVQECQKAEGIKHQVAELLAENDFSEERLIRVKVNLFIVNQQKLLDMVVICKIDLQ